MLDESLDKFSRLRKLRHHVRVVCMGQPAYKRLVAQLSCHFANSHRLGSVLG